jgi:hypothetical protein
MRSLPPTSACEVSPIRPLPKRLRPAADHPWRQMTHRAAQAGLAKKALRGGRRATRAPEDISNEL